MECASRIKYEHSPAESVADSFVSTPISYYQPLFDNTMNSIQALTPQSFDGESSFSSSVSGTPTQEKKPVKKRKSWGQKLPEPKTNLPPRKRAKTEDEKEQRRVERVLRNRRAAQSSRERKRQEVEALEAEKLAIERKNLNLEMRLADMEAKYNLLQEELERVGGSNRTHFRSYAVSTSNVPAEILRQQSPITFSQELFGCRDEINGSISSQSLSSQSLSPRTSITVDPAALSPQIRSSVDSSIALSSDMTQHPAAVLCDLQCQLEGNLLWMNSTLMVLMMIKRASMRTFLFMKFGDILVFLSLLTLIVICLKKEVYLIPIPSALNLIIWMVTMTASLINLSFVTTLMMNLKQTKFSVRTNLLRRLTTCSLNLARPFMDATVVALRLGSEQLQIRTCISTASLKIIGDSSPSFEVLILYVQKILSGIGLKFKFQYTRSDVVEQFELSPGDLRVMYNKRRGFLLPLYLF